MDKNEYFYSVIIPLYRSERSIGMVVDEVEAEFARIGIATYELVLVNDCSPDGVWAVVEDMALKDSRIIAMDLAHNSGQVQAVTAGLRVARGDYIVLMDDDLQHPGNEIGHLINAIIERDDDVVFASYDEEGNKRPLMRRLGTRLNWWMAEKLIGKPKGIDTNSFLIMKRFVRDAWIRHRGQKIYNYGIIFRATNHVSNVRMHHRERAFGRSGFTLRKLLDGWVTGALSFSPLPLRVSMFAGFILLPTSIIGMIIAVIIYKFYVGLFWGFGLLCSLQLIAIGLLGEYVNMIFSSTTGVPHYCVRSIVTSDSEVDVDLMYAQAAAYGDPWLGDDVESVLVRRKKGRCTKETGDE